MYFPDRGRKEQPLPPGIVARPITEKDLEMLREGVVPAPTLQELKPKHHSMAKAIAAGQKNIEIAAAWGISPQTIVNLKKNSAFQNLIKMFEEEARKRSDPLLDQMSAIAHDAVEQVGERIRGGEMSNNELTNTTKMLLDRVGRGPASTQIHDVGNNVGDLLEAAKKRISDMREGEVVDVTPVEENESDDRDAA